MARKEKNTVDYFPLDCKWGDSMNYIEDTYGNDGFIVWVRLLRKLGRTEYHFFDWTDTKARKIFCTEVKIEHALICQIIEELVDFDCLDKQLWEQGIIFSEKFVEGIKDAYKNRKTAPLLKKDIISFLTEKGRISGITSVRNRITSAGNDVSSVRNTQSKVKESKVNKTKSSCENLETFEHNPQEEEFLKLISSLKGYKSDYKVDLSHYKELRKKYAHEVIIESLKHRETKISSQKALVDWIAGYKEIKKGDEGIVIPDAVPIVLPEKSHLADNIETRDQAIEHLKSLYPVEIRTRGETNKNLMKRFDIEAFEFKD